MNAMMSCRVTLRHTNEEDVTMVGEFAACAAATSRGEALLYAAAHRMNVVMKNGVVALCVIRYTFARDTRSVMASRRWFTGVIWWRRRGVARARSSGDVKIIRRHTARVIGSSTRRCCASRMSTATRRVQERDVDVHAACRGYCYAKNIMRSRGGAR